MKLRQVLEERKHSSVKTKVGKVKVGDAIHITRQAMKVNGMNKAGPWQVVRIIDSGSKPSRDFPSKVIIEVDNKGIPAPVDPTNVIKVETSKKKGKIRSFFSRK